MNRRVPFLLAVALPLVFASVALAGGGDDPKNADPKKEDPKKDEPKKAGAPEQPKAEAYKGPEIAWAKSYAEAREEAAERNVAIYLHSHGST
jgi:hypothetical protein